MSVEMTVWWHLIPSDSQSEAPTRGAGGKSVDRHDRPRVAVAARTEQLLPLGSSVVAPGLAVLLPV